MYMTEFGNWREERERERDILNIVIPFLNEEFSQRRDTVIGRPLFEDDMKNILIK